MKTDPTKRFTDRVDNYVKFRPGYPARSINYLARQCKLQPESKVADVGAGTGIFTRLLLEKGCQVFAVEPNDAMREAAGVYLLPEADHLTLVNGTAEATTLPDASMDAIVCAQAFHWFNNPQTKAEFKRVLTKNGRVALVWNNRSVDADDFAIAYELLLKQESFDYNRVNHQNLTEMDFACFFRDGKYKLEKFDNVQVFDLEGLIGRAFSSSYVPAKDTPDGARFLNDLTEMFNQYQVDGTVKFHYKTEVYVGKV